MSYVEATRIGGFSADGRQNEFLNQAFRSCGIRMSKAGEVTYTTDIYAQLPHLRHRSKRRHLRTSARSVCSIT